MRAIIIVIFASVFTGFPILAQEFPPVYVSVEDDDGENISCQISSASTKAAIESALRYNRIDSASRNDFITGSALRINASVISFRLPNGTCVASQSMQLNTYQEAKLDITGEIRYVTFELCLKGGMMSGSPGGLQARLNTWFRDSTSGCVSEYLEQ